MASDAMGNIVGAAVVGVLINFWLAPDNAKTVGLLNYKPNPGYTWEDPNALPPFRKTVWTPGSLHPTISHITAATEEDLWRPDDGYGWRRNQKGDAEGVDWHAGVTHTQIRHIKSASREGYWRPDPGYVFFERGSTRSSQTERPVESNRNGGLSALTSLDVRWSPGLRHPDRPHISAAYREGWWDADAGYHFLSANDLQVARDGPDWGRVFANAITAAFADDCARNRPGDDILATAVGRPMCRGVRDAAIRDGVEALNLR